MCRVGAEKLEVATNIGRKIAIALAVLAIVLVSVFLIERRKEGKEPITEAPEPVSTETRSVTIYFGTPSAEGFVAETREIPAGRTLEESLKRLIGQLIAGPKSADYVPVMPAGTELLQVFWMEESQTVVLDFNSAFRDNHPGGSAGEHLTLGSILRTISANFPQVEKVRFLIEGKTVETLAGHYALDEPLDVRSWR